VELLIYIGIFSVVAGLVLGILNSTIRSNQAEVANNEVTTQLNTVLTDIQNQVNQSSNLEVYPSVTNLASPTSTGSFLKLRMSSTSTDPTCIYLSSSTVYMAQGPDPSNASQCNQANATALTTSQVLANNLTFTQITVPGGHASVSISLQITYNSSNPAFAISKTLQSAIGRVSAATFDDNLLPNADNTFDIGQIAPNLRWRNGNFAGTVTIGTAGGSLGIGTETPTGVLDVVASSTNALVVASNGNVGIGTSTPAALLNLPYTGSGNNTILIGNMSDLGTNNFEDSIALPNGATHWPFGITIGGNRLDAFDNSGNLLVNATGTSYFLGSLGIGTTTPTSLFSIYNGAIRLDNNNFEQATTSSAPVFVLNNDTTTMANGQPFPTGSSFTIDVAVGTGLTNLVAGAEVNSAGTGYNYLGTRGSSRIELHDGSLYLYTSATTTGTTGQPVTWSDNNGPAMTIDNNGNFLFGVSPIYNSYAPYNFRATSTTVGSRGTILLENYGNNTSWITPDPNQLAFVTQGSAGFQFRNGVASSGDPSGGTTLLTINGSNGDIYPTYNIVPSTQSNTGGGSWYFGTGAWSGGISGADSVTGLTYANGTGSQLFTLSSAPGQASLQLDGSVFIGDGLSSSPDGLTAASDGYLVVQNNAYVGGNLSVSGTLTATTKNFKITDPLNPNDWLYHSSLEGPEVGVYYRGLAQLKNGVAVVKLPNYFEALTRKTDRTVLLTPQFTNINQPVSELAASPVVNGEFTVKAIDNNNPSQAFSWEVQAVRADVPPLQVIKPKSQLK
ncbi:MAG: hypothetical protein KGL39_35125, partial [Patescibacteria group bacterium]|nr:hypothetical protein [Patescibacteria group bacterium]